MKRIKDSNPTCTYCANKAIYKASGWHSHIAPRVCEKHKNNLKIYEEQTYDDGYMTEADYQTHGRLT